VFGARAAHGLQEATLGSAWLFVLPSTSPANAAVPYAERLRWFTALADLLRGTTGSDPVVPPEAATGRPARD
jgi:G:T/U-mismatch repair DNA glycosylase